MDVPMQKPRPTGITGTAGIAKAQQRVREATINFGRVRLAWRFILVAMLICLASIVWLSQTSTIVSLGYDIEKLDKQEVLLNRQSEQLQSQVAEYENLARVEEEAKSKLGMIPAKNVVYVKVPAN